MSRDKAQQREVYSHRRATANLLLVGHDPANAEQRRRAASKGGKSKPNRDVADVKRRLTEMADGVLDGSVEKGVGAVASQILNVYLRAVSVELKVLETQELEARVEELSEAFERQQETRRHGA